METEEKRNGRAKSGSPKGTGCREVPPCQLLLVRSCQGRRGIVAWSRLYARRIRACSHGGGGSQVGEVGGVINLFIQSLFFS